MAFDGQITTAEALKAAMRDDPNYARIDNALIAARLATPPPAEVLGLAPAGAYDSFCGYTPLEEFPVAKAFTKALPEPAHLPDICNDAKTAFNLEMPAAKGPGIKMDI